MIDLDHFNREWARREAAARAANRRAWRRDVLWPAVIVVAFFGAVVLAAGCIGLFASRS